MPLTSSFSVAGLPGCVPPGVLQWYPLVPCECFTCYHLYLHEATPRPPASPPPALSMYGVFPHLNWNTFVLPFSSPTLAGTQLMFYGNSDILLFSSSILFCPITLSLPSNRLDSLLFLFLVMTLKRNYMLEYIYLFQNQHTSTLRNCALVHRSQKFKTSKKKIIQPLQIFQKWFMIKEMLMILSNI